MAQAGGLTITITGDASGVDAALQKTLQAVTAHMAGIEARLASGEQATKQFSERSARHLHGLQEAFGSLQATIGRLQSVLATLGLGVGVGAIAKSAIETAAAFEQLDTQIAFVTKSMQDFQQAKRFIVEFTATTPFQLGEVSKAFIDLTRRGFEVQRTLKAVGDVASLTKFPSQAFEGIIFALGQVADKGRLTAEELNRQLSQFGVPVGRVLEEIGKLGIDVSKGIADAGISAKVGIEAILRVLETDFKDAMKATQGNWIALMSNLKDTWTIFQDIVVRGPLFDFLKGLAFLLLNELQRAINEDAEAFQAMGTTAVTWLKDITIWVARAIDYLVTLKAPLTAVQKFLGDIEQSWGRFVDSVARGAAGGVATGLEAMLAPESTVQALRQFSARVKDESGNTLLKSLLPDKGAYEAGLESLFRAGDAAVKDANAKRDAIIAEAQKRNAALQKRLNDLLAAPAGAGGAGQSAAQAAANAAKAQEHVIQQSLKRQEALIAQSFDERRQQAEEFFAEQVRQAPGEAQQIQAARAVVFRQMAQQEATLVESVRLDSNDRMLAATLNQLQKEQAAHAGKAGDLAKIEVQVTEAYAEHATKREEILKKTGDVRTKMAKETTDEEIKEIIRANDILEKSREQGLEDFARQTRAIEQRMEREQQQIQESQLRSYENFVNRVAGMLNDIFTGLLDGTLKAVDFFKKLLIAQLANIASSVIAPFVAGLAASIATTLGSALPGSLGKMVTQGVFGPAGAPEGGLSGLPGAGGGGLMEILGLAGAGNQISQLFGGQGIGSIFSSLGKGLSFLDQSVVDMAASIQGYFGAGGTVPEVFANLESGLISTYQTPETLLAQAAAGPASPAISALGVAGGAAALGFNIYSAVTAEGIGDKIGSSIGAAAAATAIGLMVSGVGAPFAPIALAVAALAPLLGKFADTLSAPKGPRLAIGGLGGLGIGAGPGGLTVGGQLTSDVLQQERLAGVNTGEIQSQLAAGVTNVVKGMVDVINQVALEPGALLQPTQRALSDALQGIQTINSSNVKTMQADIEAQLKFTSTSIASSFLGPLNEAFRQLDSAELDQQLSRMPETTKGMVTVFKTMNTQLDELAKVANTDVLRQLSSVRQRVEAFGNALADTAAAVSTSIVDQISDQLIAQANRLLDAPLAQQITRFGAVMQDSFAALDALRATRTTLQEAGLDAGGVSEQFDRLGRLMVETAGMVSTDIVSGALTDLAARLDTVLIQPIAVQATTVNSLFSTSLAAINTLFDQWHRLEAQGIDSTGVRIQVDRLLTGMLSAVGDTLTAAFTQGSFADFLAVAASIPQAVTALNPAWQQLQQMAAAFAQALAPTLEGIRSLEDQMRTTGERATFAADRVAELRSAIADAGTAADQALPLYQQLGQAVLAQAAAEEAAIRETFARAAEAMQALNTVIDTQTSLIADLRGEQEALQQSIEGIISDQDRLISDLTSQQQDIIQGYEDLNDSLTRALTELRAEVTGLQEDIAQTLRGQASPVRAAEMIRTELMRLQGVAAGQTGAEQLETLRQQKALLDELLALGQRTDQLGVMAEARVGLEALATQLAAIGRSLDAQATANEAQLIAAKADRDAQLAVLNAQLAEAQATRTAAQAQLDWIEFQALQTAQLPSTILATAQQTWTLLQTQIAQAEADRAVATAQLQQMAGTTDLQAAQTSLTAQLNAAIQSLRENTLTQLRAIEGALREVFAAQPLAQNLLHLETQTSLQQQLVTSAGSSLQFLAGIFNLLGALNTVVEKSDVIIQALNRPLRTVAAQHGGMIMAMARGGLVPALLEPGERIFTPPMSHAQRGALMGMNTAFPRFADGGFTVPGSGSGDTVFAMVPSGSFVMNKRASGAMGYQGGGAVSGRRAPADQRPIVINVYQLPGQSTRELIEAISRQLRREFRSSNDQGPWR